MWKIFFRPGLHCLDTLGFRWIWIISKLIWKMIKMSDWLTFWILCRVAYQQKSGGRGFDSHRDQKNFFFTSCGSLIPLTVQPFGWLYDWLTDWLTDWLFDWLTAWRAADGLTGWRADGLTAWRHHGLPTNWLNWLTDLLSNKWQSAASPYINRAFKQRQPGRRRERHRIRENPKSPLRVTGGEQVDVLRLDPTRV